MIALIAFVKAVFKKKRKKAIKNTYFCEIMAGTLHSLR